MSSTDINNKEIKSEGGFDSFKGIPKAVDNQFVLNAKTSVALLPSSSKSLSILDLGCAGGKRSVMLINQLIDELKNRSEINSSLEELRFYHEDLPSNNFDEVKKCVEDPINGYINHSFIKESSIKVNYEFIKKSYYEELLPVNSVNLTLCYFSLHFLPTSKFQKFGLLYTPKYGEPELTAYFNDLANSYLTQFLNLRFSELKTGGLLCLNIPTESTFQTWINSNWKLVLSKRGLNYLDFDKIYIPLYFRPLSEIDSVIGTFTDKFKPVRSVSEVHEAKSTEEDFTKPLLRDQFKVIIYRTIIKGLEQYPNVFKDQEVRDKLYREFEDLCFNDKENNENLKAAQWIVLQKI